MSCLDTLNQQPPSGHVVVIATTNQIEGVEPSLRRPRRLDREVEIPVPSSRERREIVRIHLRNIKNSLTDDQLTLCVFALRLAIELYTILSLTALLY